MKRRQRYTFVQKRKAPTPEELQARLLNFGGM